MRSEVFAESDAGRAACLAELKDRVRRSGQILRDGYPATWGPDRFAGSGPPCVRASAFVAVEEAVNREFQGDADRLGQRDRHAALVGPACAVLPAARLGADLRRALDAARAAGLKPAALMPHLRAAGVV